MSIHDDMTRQIAIDDVVFLVVDKDGTGLVIHAAYRHGGNADVHAACVGCVVMSVQLLEQVPQSVLIRGSGFDEFAEPPTVVSDSIPGLSVTPRSPGIR